MSVKKTLIKGGKENNKQGKKWSKKKTILKGIADKSH